MELAILLAICASFCTATSSVCQRRGARSLAAKTLGTRSLGARSDEATGFDAWLIFRLARRPIWLVGLVSMIGGFLLQVSALHFGALALVQPILALELILVFAYLSVIGPRQVKRRDWLAAIAMSAGLGLFLFSASPSGGRPHAPGSLWLLAGLTTLGVVLLALALAFGLRRHRGASPSRRAAVLGVATGISWGFVAAVIKELSSYLGDGIGTILSSWSLYVLIVVGAATMLLLSHAMAAGPLAASQPGFTILDPLAASLLGVFLFGERIQTGALALAGEAFALLVLVAGVLTLSHSDLIAGEQAPSPGEHRAACDEPARGDELSAPAVRQPASDEGPGRGESRLPS